MHLLGPISFALLSFRALASAAQCYRCASTSLRNYKKIKDAAVPFTDDCATNFKSLGVQPCRRSPCVFLHSNITAGAESGRVGVVRACYVDLFHPSTIKVGVPQMHHCSSCNGVFNEYPQGDDFNKKCLVRFQALMTGPLQVTHDNEICACWGEGCNGASVVSSGVMTMVVGVGLMGRLLVPW